MAEQRALGDFLRSRRERLRPSDVGLPDSGRRRTPGLRREEVAALAGVSIDYLVRLEQGRDRNPSAGVVTALASALQLDGDERLHLKKLAQCESSIELCPFAEPDSSDGVAPTTLAVIERLGHTPAVVVSPWYQVLAHNQSWGRVMRPLGVLDRQPANLAAFTFLDERSRRAYPDWSAIADEQVAVIRDASVRWGHDEQMSDLLAELRGVEEFERRWCAHGVARKRRGEKTISHPEAGELRISYEVLHADDTTDQRVVVWVPADEVSDMAIRHLVGDVPSSPANLRLIGG